MAALSEDPELTTLYGAGDMYDLFATTHLGLVGNRKAAKHVFLSYAYPKASDISSPPCLLRLLPAGAVAGRGLHPLESAAFSRRTWIAVIG